MKHLRLFENTEKANNQVVDLPVVALVQGVENGLVMSPKSEEASAATISVSEDGNISIAVNINEDELTKGQWVDLGLPSGLKWASCNLGATIPCEYGHYYMWGSVTPNDKDDCSWSTCPWGQNNPPMTTLDAEHDAAQFAGVGRMPTKSELRELLDNTTNEWCNCTYLGDDHKEHNVMGRKFTASNGNSIFIPASGYREGLDFKSQGTLANVWSSYIFSNNYFSAFYLESNPSGCYVFYYTRYRGFTIRPVSD